MTVSLETRQIFLVLFFKKEQKKKTIVCLGLAALLGGCDLAPKYQPPVVAVPVNYAEAAPWQPALPADTAPKGAWWTAYGDKVLNGLEARLDTDNPDLAAALANVDQARALLAEARAGLLPSLGIGGQITTNRQSERRPTRRPGQPNQYMDNVLSTNATYEFDLWEKIANGVKAGQAEAVASAADLAGLRLSLQAELATSYITLRGLDDQIALLNRTIATYGKVVELTQNRFAGRIASGLDVARASAQYHDAQAQLADVAARRALAAHAVAIVCGVTPAALPIAPETTVLRLPEVGTGVPSGLLQRRPDVAAAERDMAAANATIGITKAAFYPNISLNALLGLQDTGFNMFTLPDSFWTVGPAFALPLFEGGLRHAKENAAKAAYRRAVEAYKAVVLRAFGEVEDQLALLHYLGEEKRAEDASLADARATVRMSMAAYDLGTVNFLDLAVAQAASLQAERNSLDLRTRILAASVGLTRALGGGWNVVDLPKVK
jgi:NodT family efflux transporter outer membrane factor (OMF) lipoprotein